MKNWLRRIFDRSPTPGRPSLGTLFMLNKNACLSTNFAPIMNNQKVIEFWEKNRISEKMRYHSKTITV